MYGKIIDKYTKSCMVCEKCTAEEAAIFGLKELDVEKAYNGTFYLKGYAPEKPTEQKSAEARAERDRRIDAIRWRIERHQTQEAAGLETTDTAEHYKAILLYVQALRDVPAQAGFPDAIEWPEEP